MLVLAKLYLLNPNRLLKSIITILVNPHQTSKLNQTSYIAGKTNIKVLLNFSQSVLILPISQQLVYLKRQHWHCLAIPLQLKMNLPDLMVPSFNLPLKTIIEDPNLQLVRILIVFQLGPVITSLQLSIYIHTN